MGQGHRPFLSMTYHIPPKVYYYWHSFPIILTKKLDRITLPGGIQDIIFTSVVKYIYRTSLPIYPLFSLTALAQISYGGHTKYIQLTQLCHSPSARKSLEKGQMEWNMPCTLRKVPVIMYILRRGPVIN